MSESNKTSKEYNYQVVQREWIPKIQKSNFKTQDDSIFYGYIISPFCNCLINFIPRSIA